MRKLGNTIRRSSKRRFVHFASAVVFATALVGVFTLPAQAGSFGGSHGHVPTTTYTQTNAASGNEILAYRQANGSLTQVASYDTGGAGSGNGLGSQGAVTISGRWLLAVNAGSDSLTLFRVGPHGTLQLADVEPTGGDLPVSVTVRGNVVYVLNAGDSTVSGFRIRGRELVAIRHSLQSLPGNGGAQISFDRTGRRLVVSEKATNTIDVLPVRLGVAGAAVSNPSSGETPFGFAIDRRNHIVVSNAAGGADGASSLSSYRFTGRATITPVSEAVGTTQTAACWVELSADGRYAFTTNAGSGTISSYRVGRDGELTLAEAVAAAPGAGPLDMVVVGDELYTLNNGSHTITVHDVSRTGTLSPAGEVAVPAGIVGLAAA